MAVTIQDVAREAGVSKATVSYVLNGRETSVRIPEATSRRVREAAQALNYHPNAVARALTHKRTATVTLVMQYARIFSGWSGFTNEMMRGAAEAAIRRGYDLMLHTRDQATPEQEAAALSDGRADGALLLRDLDDPLADMLAARGFPCVLMFSRGVRPGVASVDCDNVAGGRLATDYLLDLGHRRIMHLAGTARSASAYDRRAGYEQALAARGIAPRPEWCVEVTFAGAAYDKVEALLRSPERPTAAFAWSDEVAVRLMTLARGIGLRVPHDLSVIGYDSTEFCNHTDPPLTSVRQPIYEMAAEALDMVIGQIERDTTVADARLFPPALQVRGTTAPV